VNWKQQLHSLFDDQSKDLIVNYLISHPEEIHNIINLINDSDERPAWRAAWIIDHLNQNRPELVMPHLFQLANILKKTTYNGARRSLLKILITNPSPINEDGELVDLCFQWVISPSEPIAIRAYAMQFIFDLLSVYPDLKFELRSTLETVLDDESKGVRGKARKVLTWL
jgi:hypothetical protein